MPHSTVKRLLARALEAALLAAKLDWIVDQETSVDFGEGFQPLPDIVIWERSAAQGDLTGAIPARAVRLIVEVADTTLSDDLGEKREDYATAGLAEYWVEDVKNQLIVQHAQPVAGACAAQASTRFGASATSLAYPALRVATMALKAGGYVRCPRIMVFSRR